MSTQENAINRYDVRILTDSITRPSNTTQYTAGDVIAEVTSNDYFTFGNIDTNPAGRFKNHPTASITGARITSSANQSTKLDAELVLFNDAFTETADNSAWDISDAQILTRIGSIDFAEANWSAGNATAGAGGNAFCDVQNLGIVYELTADMVLYGALIARNTYTPVSAEVFTISLILTLD